MQLCLCKHRLLGNIWLCIYMDVYYWTVFSCAKGRANVLISASRFRCVLSGLKSNVLYLKRYSTGISGHPEILGQGDETESRFSHGSDKKPCH